MHPAIFLDKDGTLIEDVPYNVDPRRIRLMPGAGPALAQLHRAGYRLVVASNQSGVARGLFPESALQCVGERLASLLARYGVPLAGCYWCPHWPAGVVPRYAVSCDCRKPSPGLILRAAKELDLDVSHSWMIGDILDDVRAGHRAGCRSALLLRGGDERMPDGERPPDVASATLRKIARQILAAPRPRSIADHSSAKETP